MHGLRALLPYFDHRPHVIWENESGVVVCFPNVDDCFSERHQTRLRERKAGRWTLFCAPFVCDVNIEAHRSPLPFVSTAVEVCLEGGGCNCRGTRAMCL